MSPLNRDHSQPDTGRRAFFSRMMGEAVAVVDDSRGVPHFRLSDLPDYPPDKLAKLIPVIREGTRIFLDDDAVWGTPPGGTESVRLFPATDDNARVFNRFTGETTVGDIAAELAAAAGRTADEAFEQTRQLFLTLVQARVCVPNNDPE